MDHASPLTEEQRQAVEEFRRRHRTGVLALLFTDVERSTALRGEMGEMPASALLERHGVTIREVLGRFPEAHLISTAGDSFFMVFAKPSDAVRFALLAQLRLRTLAAQNRPGFRVNIGTHLGEVVVEERAETGKVFDVLGMQVDIAARVTALASSGQILMTRGVFDNARQILKGQWLPGVGELSWMSHGPYLLKGFDEPLAICEVGEIGIAPLRSPADCDMGKRAAVPGTELVLGWRPAVERVVPGTEWVLTEKIGEGGFGEVWHASHRRTREQRVFKFCFRADRLRSLKHEMTLFRVLKEVLGERSDIARLYNVQFEEAPYYLEVEYTAGGNLAEWLKKQEVRGRRPEARETQDSALGTQDSALRTQDSALRTQHWALRTQHTQFPSPCGWRLSPRSPPRWRPPIRSGLSTEM
jgi:serine/threonine-protein kinase